MQLTRPTTVRGTAVPHLEARFRCTLTLLNFIEHLTFACHTYCITYCFHHALKAPLPRRMSFLPGAKAIDSPQPL